MPGGGVEWGEHPDAAVLRELEEEAGITDVRDVARSIPTSTNEAQRPHDSFHHVGIDLRGDSRQRSPSRPEPDGSTDRCEWFTEHQARNLPLVPIARFAVALAWPKP